MICVFSSDNSRCSSFARKSSDLLFGLSHAFDPVIADDNKVIRISDQPVVPQTSLSPFLLFVWGQVPFLFCPLVKFIEIHIGQARVRSLPPCGTPVSVRANSPSSITPALRNFQIRSSMSSVCYPSLEEAQELAMMHVIEVALDISFDRVVVLDYSC